MSDPRQTTEPQDPRIKAALAEYMEQVDRGETVDRQQFLALHADIAADLESFISTAEQLGKMAGLKPVLATLPPPPEASTRSIAAQGEETLIPKRVTGDAKATLIQGLPERFGRYRVLKPLGSGAMGTVYLAEDTQLERKVALKTPSFDEDESGELLQRFYREAKAAATLRNPHICPVYDVGEIGGKHYISMAWIQGRPLSAYIQPDKPQAERQILIIIRKLALALDEAHRHGIIHRDLKPGNVMIDEKGEPIVMDFGLARRTQREDVSRLTQSGMIVGSPAYMSPEQVEGDSEKIGPSADQYSLGVILYELLTGQLPFRGGVTAVIGAILTKEPTPVTELRKGVDPRVAALCARMMTKRAAERYPSLKAVADEVTALLKDAGAPTGKDAARESVKASRAAEGPTKPQATQGAKIEKGAEAAAAVSITASNVTSLFEAAQKCLRRHDYEQVVQMLQQIPETKRTEEVKALLAKARQLADEVSFLLAEIDEAERVNDNAVLTRATDELLKLKPKHHKALQIKDELSRYGKGKLWKPGGYTPDGRRIGEGSWIPWIGIAVGVIAFAITTWAVTIYLKAGDAVVRVQINNPDVKVEFQNRTLNIQSANKEFKVEPGENTLKITYGDSEFETDRFTLKDGENPAVVVELLDKTLAAKFGEESIGSWDVKPAESGGTPPGTSAASETTAGAGGGDFVYELRTHTCPPGRLDALIARYRDHTEPAFQKHGITSIAYWTPIEEPQASNTLLVLFRHESREAAARSWQAVRNDRPPLAVVQELYGEIGDQQVKSVFLKLTESSPIPGPVSSGKAYELRGATASAESVPAPNDPSRQEMGARLLARHGMKAYASFAATDETLSDSNRYRILEYQDEGSYKSARQALVDDPEYKAMRAERETAGAVAGSITSMFLRSADNLIRPSTSTSPVPADAVDFQGHSYKYFGERLTWKEAKQRCEQLGGHLPIVETAAENAFLNDLADKGFPSAGRNGLESVWLGATDEVKEGEWRWVDGTRAAYLNWRKVPGNAPGTQPNNNQGIEHYATLWLSRDPNRANGLWSDQPNQSTGQTVHFICEWDAVRASSSTAASAVPPDSIPTGRYDVLFNKDQGWLYTYRIDADRFTRETVDILGSGKGPQPLTEGRGTIEKLAAGKFRLTYDPSTWNGKPPAEVWTAKGSDGSYTSEYWFPVENYAAQKPPNLTGVATPRAGSGLSGVAPPRLVPLTELNTPGWDAYAMVSPDGLRIYWEAPPASGGTARHIWSAERPDAASPFQNKQALFAGRQPTLTPDEKQIIFEDTTEKALLTATRGSTTASFGAPRRLSQFSQYEAFNSPSIAADGLSLVVNGMPAGQQAASAFVPLVARRASIEEEWGPPAPLELTWDLNQHRVPPTWIAVAPDGLSLLATHEGIGGGRVVRLTRSAVGQPFTGTEHLTLEGIGPMYGKAPRYVPATRELYVTVEARFASSVPGAALKPGDNGDLYVIRNVDLWPSAPATGTAAAGWTDLFDGTDLTGWTIHKSEGAQPPISWAADSERQVIVANSGGQNWLETDRTFRDFVLTLDWRFPPGKFVSPNGSGIVVRAEGLNSINYDPKGVEIDLLRSTSADKTRGPGAFVTYDTRIVHSTGATPERGNGMKGTITEPQVSAVTNWNICEITCQGDRISVTMNGVLVNEATGVPQRAGKICLRSQNADVEFRNVRIRPIGGPSEDQDAAAALQGTWTAVGQEIAGGVWTQEQIAEHEKSMSFADDTFEIRYRDRSGQFQVERGTFRLDLSQDPPHITMNGTNRDGRAIEFVGIYQLRGDQLRHCFVKTSDNRTAARPTGFSTSAGSGRFSTTYRRVRELDASVTAGGAPELVSLSELNTPEYESVPWASTDGLRIYWEGPPPAGQEGQWIWTADRPAGSASFANKRALFAGHHPVLTGDELEVVFTRPLGMGRFETFSATRQSAGDSFGPPQPLPHFGPAGALNIPWLSADGLKLYVTSVVPGNWPEYLLARRASRTDNWGAPEPHDIRWDRSQPGPAPQWISVSDDELTLLGTREGDVGQWRVVRSTRSAVNEPFSDWEYVSVPGIGQVHGRTPRYSPATRELFLWATLDYGQASQAAGWKEPSDLWVIRNVDLP